MQGKKAHTSDESEIARHDQEQAKLDSEFFALNKFKQVPRKAKAVSKPTQAEDDKLDKTEEELNKKYEILMSQADRFKQEPKVALKSKKNVAQKPDENKEKQLDKSQEDLDKAFYRLSFKEKSNSGIIDKSAKQSYSGANWPSPYNPVRKGPRAKSSDKKDEEDEDVHRQYWPSPLNPVNKGPLRIPMAKEEVQKEPKRHHHFHIRLHHHLPSHKKAKIFDNERYSAVDFQRAKTGLSPSKSSAFTARRNRLQKLLPKAKHAKIFDNTRVSAIDFQRAKTGLSPSKTPAFQSRLAKIFDNTRVSAIDFQRAKTGLSPSKTPAFQSRFKETPTKSKIAVPTQAQESDLDKKQEELDRQFMRYSFKQYDNQSKRAQTEARQAEQQQKRANQQAIYAQEKAAKRAEQEARHAQMQADREAKKAEHQAVLDAKRSAAEEKAREYEQKSFEAKQIRDQQNKLNSIRGSAHSAALNEYSHDKQAQHKAKNMLLHHVNNQATDAESAKLDKDFERIMNERRMKQLNLEAKFKEVATPKKAVKTAVVKSSGKSDLSMSDLDISPEQLKLDQEFDKVMMMDRFKSRSQAKHHSRKHRATPKKAVKSTPVANSGKASNEDNVADLNVSKDEFEMNKKFNSLMDRDTRFKSVPVKKAVKATNSPKSNVVDVSDLEPSADEVALDKQFDSIMDKAYRFKKVAPQVVKSKNIPKVDESKVDKDQEELDRQFLKFERRRK